MSRPRALIIGVSGQDGSYLAQLLLAKGYEVYGGWRPGPEDKLWRLRELQISDQIRMLPVNLAENSSLERAFAESRPDEVYNLAGQSFVGSALDETMQFAETVALPAARIMSVLFTHHSDCKFLQASSSEIFGNSPESPQRETSPCLPRTQYGLAKLYAHQLVRIYREQKARFACSAILFNHESPLRGQQFVTQKVVRGLVRAYLGEAEILQLGSLTSRRDWGFAPEYVEAMWRMLQRKVADDYVLATGVTHSVQELVEAIAGCVGFDIVWRTGPSGAMQGVDRPSGRVLVSAGAADFRPAEEVQLVGDASRARELLGWTSQVNFVELIQIMTRAELARQNGPRADELGARR